MKKVIIYVFLFVININGIIAQQNNEGCDDPIYNLMDFWIGDWNVYENNKLVGTNSIEKIVGGCAVKENWRNIFNQEGKSLFFVSNKSKNWKQVWVTANSNKPWGQKEKELLYYKKDSLLVFQGTYTIKEKLILDRTQLLKLPSQEVKQTIQTSNDGGESWKIQFIGLYSRRKK